MISPVEALLCRLADPERLAEPVAPDLTDSVIELARPHGVLPAVLRKLSDRLPPDRLRALNDEVGARVGPMLHLRMIKARVDALAATGLPLRIVKGPVMADLAYPNRSDRPFGDLDILTVPEAHEAIAGLLTGLGYSMYRKPVMDHTESNQEQKWLHPEASSLLVEVHGNLVHYEGLRQHVSFGYAEFTSCERRSPALAMFFTAVVHGTLGHKLRQLKLLVDILQTFRRLSPEDRRMLPVMAGELRVGPETVLGLTLVAQLFDVPEADDAAQSVRVGRGFALARRLIDPESVFPDSGPVRAVVRHRLFRLYQHMASR